jgi:hypothetical protein
VLRNSILSYRFPISNQFGPTIRLEEVCDEEAAWLNVTESSYQRAQTDGQTIVVDQLLVDEHSDAHGDVAAMLLRQFDALRSPNRIGEHGVDRFDSALFVELLRQQRCVWRFTVQSLILHDGVCNDCVIVASPSRQSLHCFIFFLFFFI